MTRNDMDQFWKDDETAHRENTFYSKAPQVALGIRMSGECVYTELGEEGDPWAAEPAQRRYELNCRYNDLSEKIVGKRLLPEIKPEDVVTFPAVKRIGEVFEGTYESQPMTGEWLHSPIETPAELEAMLDRVDMLDLRRFILPDNWEAEKKRIYEKTGKRTPLHRWVRGPVTLGTSIFGVENLIFLYFDNPDLFKRFGQTIKRVLMDLIALFDQEAGYTKETRPAGFGFADDDCNLMTPEMYEVFGYPTLRDVFAEYSPDWEENPEEHSRYQHSDSAMEHLLPILGKVNLTGCNFGPTVLVDEIRKHMPRTRIDGCLAPFTFMRNNPQNIRSEVIRDIKMIKEARTRGLNISTAGSINNGSSLESLRVIMETILEYGRY
jgi:uroporphyrinogen decarboxylase